ncbi:MAG: 3-dehydroquinate synthase, partial [Armatimonadetes bacterium]|nr:3-dehydroquinate synthase [Armatimonadota bacterium]
GGMVGDMAGLAASLYMRGIRCVQVPTTLLAQVDASVGGKTGVNLRSGKNLIGAFHQPSAAYADPCSLATLPLRELRCGLAEVLKHGFIRDRAYLSGVLREMPLLLSCDPAALSRAVLGSCRIKAAVVEADETEQGVRAVLNFGHTIGHALETLDGYRRMRHGEAVAIGMVGACLVGEEVGVTAPNVTEAVRQALNAAGLPTCAPGSLTAEGIIAAMGADKKSERGSPRFVLLREVGHAEPGHRIELEPLRRALDRARND